MLYDNFIQFRSRLVGMADEVDSKSIGSDTVRVQVPQPALLGRGESLKNNMVYVVFKAFSFLQRKIESCSQDSPPAAGRFSDTLPLCRSAIPRSVFCVIGRSFL